MLGRPTSHRASDGRTGTRCLRGALGSTAAGESSRTRCVTVRWALTPDGREALLACREAADAIEERMLAGLSPHDRQQFEAALRACIGALT